MKSVKLFFDALILVCIISNQSCSNTNKNSKKIITPAPLSLNEWSLETSPNNLDLVGTILTFDTKNEPLRIPGGVLELKTNKSKVILTEQTFTKSFSSILRFLQISIDKDSLMYAGLNDSIKTNVNFSVNNGIITNINDDITTAFEKQKKLIEANMQILDFDTSKVYLIIETIQSPTVNMVFDKSSKINVNTFLNLKKVISVSPQIENDINRRNTLIYNIEEPLVVFYKYKKLNVKVSKIKGQTGKKIELSL